MWDGLLIELLIRPLESKLLESNAILLSSENNE